MLDVTLNELISVLGNPTRTTGHQYYFRCPACSSMGGDTSGDNLLFNDKKGVLKCFACDDGAKEVLRMINSKRHDNGYTPTANMPRKQYTPWWQKNIDNLWQYWVEASNEMTAEARQWLHNCGILDETIDEWMIGFDSDPNIVHIGPCVCFPMISLNHDNQLVGFELRQVSDKKVIRHTYDAPSCLCCIADNNKARCLVICEGFKDAYCFMQFLKLKKILQQFTILTPAHGVSDIYHNLDVVNFTRYDYCYLLLDRDEAGDRETKKIMKQYHFFIDRRDMLGECEDVAEWWTKKYVKTISKR